MEAMERKKVEERVLEMLESSRSKPIRSMTTPLPASGPTTPTKDKEGGWWTATKNKLTPTKDKDKELTPAQQVIADAKAKEKDKRKSKGYDNWPANGAAKYQDPALTSLASTSASSLSLPPGARPHGGLVGSGANIVPVSNASASGSSPQPQPQRGGSRTPSPSRSSGGGFLQHHNDSTSNLSQSQGQGIGASPRSIASTTNNETPLYAQFAPDGTLDMASMSLCMIYRTDSDIYDQSSYITYYRSSL